MHVSMRRSGFICRDLCEIAASHPTITRMQQGGGAVMTSERQRVAEAVRRAQKDFHGF
jgi:hypothetical protein